MAHIMMFSLTLDIMGGILIIEMRNAVHFSFSLTAYRNRLKYIIPRFFHARFVVNLRVGLIYKNYTFFLVGAHSRHYQNVRACHFFFFAKEII